MRVGLVSEKAKGVLMFSGIKLSYCKDFAGLIGTKIYL
jgi:hypothetical protein